MQPSWPLEYSLEVRRAETSFASGGLAQREGEGDLPWTIWKLTVSHIWPQGRGLGTSGLYHVTCVVAGPYPYRLLLVLHFPVLLGRCLGGQMVVLLRCLSPASSMQVLFGSSITWRFLLNTPYWSSASSAMGIGILLPFSAPDS